MSYQESFLKYLKFEKRCSDHTIVAYKKDLDQFEEFGFKTVGDFNILTADGKLIRQWIVALMEMGDVPKTVVRKITALKSFYKYLMRQEMIVSSPAEMTITPKIAKKLPSFVDENSLHMLLDNGYFGRDFEGMRDKLMISLFYCSGMRLSELKNLREKDILPAESLVRVLGKNNKERIIPYPGSLNSVLSDYLLQSRVPTDARHCSYLPSKRYMRS